MAIITINGRAFPGPDKGGKLTVATNVSQGKNALGEFVGQKVGRDQYKFDSLQWKLLDAKTWSDMLKEFEKSVGGSPVWATTTGSPSRCIQGTGQRNRLNLTQTASQPCTRIAK